MTVAVSKPATMKNSDKIPTSFKSDGVRTPVSPTSVSLGDEVLALRARNKILSDTLKAVKEQADEKAKRNFELVWFARNRSRYPNHKASKFLEVKHAKELAKLRSPDGDYFHGFHAGVLATAKMFQEHADILHVNEHEELNEALQVEAVKHSKKILKSQESFPDLNTDKFPEVE